MSMIRSVLFGIYGAALTLIAIGWLVIDYRPDPPIPMLYGVLGFDAFLHEMKDDGIPYFYWNSSYLDISRGCLGAFVACLGVYVVFLNRITKSPAASRFLCYAEAWIRAVLWTALGVALFTAVASPWWSGYFFDHSRTGPLHDGWMMRRAKQPECVGTIKLFAAVAVVLWPLAFWRRTPSRRRMAAHLLSIAAIALALGTIALPLWWADAYVYWSPWKTVLVLTLTVFLFVGGTLISLLPPMAAKRIQLPDVGLGFVCATVGYGLIAAFFYFVFPQETAYFFGQEVRYSGRSWHFQWYGILPAVLTYIGACLFCIAGSAWYTCERMHGQALCPRCGYDLRGTVWAGRTECPECGEAIQELGSPGHGH